MHQFTLNGQTVSAEADENLLEYLRETQRLTSLKNGCGFRLVRRHAFNGLQAKFGSPFGSQRSDDPAGFLRHQIIVIAMDHKKTGRSLLRPGFLFNL